MDFFILSLYFTERRKKNLKEWKEKYNKTTFYMLPILQQIKKKEENPFV